MFNATNTYCVQQCHDSAQPCLWRLSLLSRTIWAEALGATPHSLHPWEPFRFPALPILPWKGLTSMDRALIPSAEWSVMLQTLLFTIQRIGSTILLLLLLCKIPSGASFFSLFLLPAYSDLVTCGLLKHIHISYTCVLTLVSTWGLTSRFGPSSIIAQQTQHVCT